MYTYIYAYAVARVSVYDGLVGSVSVTKKKRWAARKGRKKGRDKKKGRKFRTVIRILKKDSNHNNAYDEKKKENSHCRTVGFRTIPTSIIHADSNNTNEKQEKSNVHQKKKKKKTREKWRCH